MKTKCSEIKANPTAIFLERLQKYYEQKRGTLSAAKRINPLFDGLSNKDIKDIFSDPYWNRYPTWTYSSNTDKDKRHGFLIYQLVRDIIKYSTPQKELLLKYSTGIFLKIAISMVSPFERKALVNRAAKSKDARVRKQAAKLLPVKNALIFLNDKNSSVRQSVKSRLLNDDKYVHLLDDGKDIWHLAKAYPSFKLSKERIQSDIEKYSEKLKAGVRYRWHNHLYSQILLNLLSRLPKEELLFYLHLSGEKQYSEINQLFELRLGE